MDIPTLVHCITTPSCLVTQSIAGLISGTLLFLVASGVTLIFGVLGFVNFMHGSFYMLGAYFAYSILLATGSFTLAVLFAAFGVAIVGLLMERIVIRNIYGSSDLVQILVCYAFILIFDDVVRLVWGSEFLSMGMPAAFRLRPYVIGGGIIPPFYIFLIGITLAITVCIVVTLYFTRYGKIVRAAAHNRQMVEALGVNTSLVYSSVFTLGVLLAGAAGALAAPVRSLTSGMGFSILIESFIVTVIGGMGSVIGALLASILLGLTRSFGGMGFPLFTDGLIFTVMAIVLVLRPSGLFSRGKRAI